MPRFNLFDCRSEFIIEQRYKTTALKFVSFSPFFFALISENIEYKGMNEK